MHFGLPAKVNAGITSFVSAERANHQKFIEYTRQQLLDEPSTSTVALNPSVIPSLVEAACRSFHNLANDDWLEIARKQLDELALNNDSVSSQDDASGSDGDDTASSGSDDHEEPEDDLHPQEGEEDENAPIKPGEVPPLDAKYLPIFQALHERGKVLTRPEKTYLVNMTGLTYRQITIWFQNRRRGELKEDSHMRASSSRAGSMHSLESSDASEDEIDFEQRFSNVSSDTTFNIRSWRLTSAMPAKAGSTGSSCPPTKLSFGAPTVISDADTDDTDLSDVSDNEMEVPPGLNVPSLTMSLSTPASTTSGPRRFPRRGALRLLRHSNPRRPSAQQAPGFNFNFAGATPSPTQNQFLPASTQAPAQPSQFVTSNERGLTVEMDTTPPASMRTLRPSPPPVLPPISSNLGSSSLPAATLPPSPAVSTGSPHSASSPTPSAQCASSPRPAVKPLPRRTGCAPRPRPPPRAGSVSTPAVSAATPSSTRSSVVLPLSSNPSLGNTTLGALLRPNPPAPRIPAQMEERLSAMAGRMGVGSSSDSARRSISTDTATYAHAGLALPPRGSPFTFGPTTLPGVSTLPGSTLAPIPGQQAQTRNNRSPSS